MKIPLIFVPSQRIENKWTSDRKKGVSVGSDSSERCGKRTVFGLKNKREKTFLPFKTQLFHIQIVRYAASANKSYIGSKTNKALRRSALFLEYSLSSRFQHLLNQLFYLISTFNSGRISVKNIIFIDGSLHGYFCTWLCCLEEYSQTALYLRFKLFGYESFNTPCSNMIIERCIVDKPIGHILPTLVLYIRDCRKKNKTL